MDRETQSLERSEVRGQSYPPPRVLVIPPYESHSSEERDKGCGKAGTYPPHWPPPSLPGLWVPAIFGQKILPQLRDA